MADERPWRSDPEGLATVREDASGLTGSPEYVARPRTPEDLAYTVRDALRAGIPVTPGGGFTSTTGAPLAPRGLSIDCRGLAGIEDLETGVDEAFVTVLPGTPLGWLRQELRTQGWLLPPDPTSAPDCTAGGIVATNANGPRSLVYGATRNWVDAVELIDGRGIRRWWSRSRAEKHGSGFAFLANPLNLICGSEGTLGVFCRVRFRCIRAPQQTTGLLIPCPNLASAVDLVIAARRERLPASCIEGFDRTALQIAAAVEPRVGGLEAALWIEFDHDATERSRLLDRWAASLEARGLAADTAIVTDEQGLRRVHNWRHSIPDTLNREGRQARPGGGAKLSTDWCVPVTRLATALGIVDELLAERGLTHIRHARYGHFGNGHPHHNWVTTQAQETDAIRDMIAAAARRIQRIGGWFAAEHGIGKLKRPLAETLIDPALLVSARAVRAQFDPHGLCAPGNLCMP